MLKRESEEQAAQRLVGVMWSALDGDGRTVYARKAAEHDVLYRKPGNKRATSAYNMFVREKFKEIRATGAASTEETHEAGLIRKEREAKASGGVVERPASPSIASSSSAPKARVAAASGPKSKRRRVENGSDRLLEIIEGIDNGVPCPYGDRIQDRVWSIFQREQISSVDAVDGLDIAALQSVGVKLGDANRIIKAVKAAVADEHNQ